MFAKSTVLNYTILSVLALSGCKSHHQLDKENNLSPELEKQLTTLGLTYVAGANGSGNIDGHETTVMEFNLSDGNLINEKKFKVQAFDENNDLMAELPEIRSIECVMKNEANTMVRSVMVRTSIDPKTGLETWGVETYVSPPAENENYQWQATEENGQMTITTLELLKGLIAPPRPQ